MWMIVHLKENNSLGIVNLSKVDMILEHGDYNQIYIGANIMLVKDSMRYLLHHINTYENSHPRLKVTESFQVRCIKCNEWINSSSSTQVYCGKCNTVFNKYTSKEKVINKIIYDVDNVELKLNNLKEKLKLSLNTKMIEVNEFVESALECGLPDGHGYYCNDDELLEQVESYDDEVKAKIEDGTYKYVAWCGK